ncbi:hypothetical protein SODALDRAFT_374965 [Sodiomyces alkalinus F11]|uniref:Dynamin N-terminal domain-containing protein n=1 Tax=Sodiomyces alkalinus (strain CBS 110278 / VKM F-3762 / F11) TaxID=1314773 RepID=A0A3N2Q7N7_SODAK|nr:hypothetical protein SODALDRAFT_374965 [Sodiomyces alkalinus F11]ROT42678.1 hypothetical protein SODALDRAFT_374965 [Sodiomyces alkalinus F11]
MGPSISASIEKKPTLKRKVPAKSNVRVKRESKTPKSSKTPPAAPVAHTWENCDGLEDFQRLALKEKAVQNAIGFLNDLASKIRLAVEQNPDVTDSSLKELQKWAEDKETAIQKHREFQILVGVAGSTGAGKTSLLNALLGASEFLPSSCEQAATAVVCQILWNHDETPGREYRAEFLQAVEDRRDIDEQEYEDEDLRTQDAAEAQKTIDGLIGKINTIWDLDPEDLKQMTPEKLLDSDAAVLNLLGTTLHLHRSDADELSRMVRPYLDSTAHRHGGEGERAFAAWPLVKHVRQYLRVDILKSGISLVDLPGLGDMNESRAAVAREFYESLAVTMIVAPIIRAADEKTAISLLGNYQELQLQMDGRFNKKGFAFVVSKTDDINVDGYLKRSQNVADSEVVQDYDVSKKLDEELRQLDAEVKARQKEFRKLNRHLKGVTKQVAIMVTNADLCIGTIRRLENELKTLKYQKKDARKQATVHRRLVSRAMKLRTTKSKQRERHRSRLIFHCTTMRNSAVQKRIVKDFEHRQRKFKGSRSSDASGDRNDEGVEVIPVSTVAFWQLQKNERMPGFPRDVYTGVPRTKSWLQEATLGRREEHLDSVLNSYATLLNWIQHWSQSQSVKTNMGFTKGDVEEILTPVHERFRELLQAQTVVGFHDQIMDIDPLRNKDDLAEICSKKAKRVVGRWHLLYPESETNTTHMHWQTYQANIRRDGGPFAGTKSEYHWIEQLVIPVLELIVEQWDEEFNNKLPALIKPMTTRVSLNWDSYMKEISSNLKDLDDKLLGPFERCPSSFQPIQKKLGDEVRRILGNIAGEAARCRVKLIRDLQDSMRPIFYEALSVRVKGSYAARRGLIMTKALQNGIEMFRIALHKMDKNLRKDKAQLPESFASLAATISESVRLQLSAVFEGVLPRGTGSKEGLSKRTKIQLRKEIQMLVVQWQASWKASCGGLEWVERPDPCHVPKDFDNEELDVSETSGSETDPGDLDDMDLDTDNEE